MSSQKIRVLLAKPGLDGHDRGVKVVARAMGNAGIEVIYTGLHQTPEQILQAAIQEDVDIVGLSILSGAHMTVFPRIRQMLNEHNAADIVLIGGGIIPQDDILKLKSSGAVTEIFTPGTPVENVVHWVKAKNTH